MKHVGKKRINILIVDDSRLVRNILKDILEFDDSIHVIGEAKTGEEAIAKTADLHPDVITMDVKMPDMDGFEATEHIMAFSPTPILIFSSAIDKNEKYTTFKAISLGALDIMSKPDITQKGFKAISDSLIRKIKTLSRINVIPHIRGKLKSKYRDSISIKEGVGFVTQSPQIVPQKMDKIYSNNYQIIAIGASTGGPGALQKVLPHFPSNFPVGIVIVQHIARGFIKSYAEWLNSKIALKVTIARDKELIRSGTVYFAPDDVHMMISADNRISLREDLPPWGKHKPSVNHLFGSIADNLGGKAIGLILTGMGKDGAEGIDQLYKKGGYTIAQDQRTSIIFGMPKVAIEKGAICRVLPLENIPKEIIKKITG